MRRILNDPDSLKQNTIYKAAECVVIFQNVFLKGGCLFVGDRVYFSLQDAKDAVHIDDKEYRYTISFSINKYE